MKAIILAAGYATRLRPLTDSLAKPLLPVGGRPMVDWLHDKLLEVTEVDGVYLVTNHRFAGDFTAWARGRAGRLTPRVIDDGTTSADDRLGAIGDIHHTIERAGLAGEDLLVVAGDNLFDFRLVDMVEFWRARPGTSAVALGTCEDLELVRRYSTVDLDASGRVIGFVEKPAQPTSTLVALATYLYHRDHAARITEYLAAGHSPDSPGRLVEWLHARVPVHGYRVAGDWRDIGDHTQLLEADNQMRAQQGLAARTVYSVHA